MTDGRPSDGGIRIVTPLSQTTLAGMIGASRETVSRAMRPVNDVLQTLPQLVYIIPFIYLMPVSIVPGIVAGVLYAFPVVVRLVERGINDVAPEAVEAAGAFGATRRQVLAKVKVPLAGDAIMLGVNQGIIMVLAVVVIGGLVGSGGLGYEVAQGLVRGYFGQGVIASFAILALGITLDRVTRIDAASDFFGQENVPRRAITINPARVLGLDEQPADFTVTVLVVVAGLVVLGIALTSVLRTLALRSGVGGKVGSGRHGAGHVNPPCVVGGPRQVGTG